MSLSMATRALRRSTQNLPELSLTGGTPVHRVGSYNTLAALSSQKAQPHLQSSVSNVVPELEATSASKKLWEGSFWRCGMCGSGTNHKSLTTCADCGSVILSQT